MTTSSRFPWNYIQYGAVEMMGTFCACVSRLRVPVLSGRASRLLSTQSAWIQWCGFPRSSKASRRVGRLLLLKKEVNRATGFLDRAERETMCAFSSLSLQEAFLDLSLQGLRPGKGQPRVPLGNSCLMLRSPAHKHPKSYISDVTIPVSPAPTPPQ